MRIPRGTPRVITRIASDVLRATPRAYATPTALSTAIANRGCVYVLRRLQLFDHYAQLLAQPHIPAWLDVYLRLRLWPHYPRKSRSARCC